MTSINVSIDSIITNNQLSSTHTLSFVITNSNSDELTKLSKILSSNFVDNLKSFSNQRLFIIGTSIDNLIIENGNIMTKWCVVIDNQKNIHKGLLKKSIRIDCLSSINDDDNDDENNDIFKKLQFNIKQTSSILLKNLISNFENQSQSVETKSKIFEILTLLGCATIDQVENLNFKTLNEWKMMIESSDDFGMLKII
jgi:hypothetical protein